MFNFNKSDFYFYRSSRSETSRKRKNQKTKLRNQRKKIIASVLTLAEKDRIIENLKSKVLHYEVKLAIKNHAIGKKVIKCEKNAFAQKSIIEPSAVIATQGKRHSGISMARQFVLASLSGVPSFEPDQVEWLDTSEKNFGSGQFGELKLLKLKKLGNLVVAAKVCKLTRSSKKAVDVETVIGMTVGGHISFPYIYGLINETYFYAILWTITIWKLDSFSKSC